MIYSKHDNTICKRIYPRPNHALHLSYEFEESEHITNMECVALRSAETASGTKSYIVCSVMTSMGEEVTCKGKVCVVCAYEV